MADITKIDTFIQSSPHPAWLATDQGHCVYANPALVHLAGFNADQINQADWRSFLLEEDRAAASASWQNLSVPRVLTLPGRRRPLRLSRPDARTTPSWSEYVLSWG